MTRQSPNNNHRVRWRSPWRWKSALNRDKKNNNDRNFQFTKFSFIDFVHTDKRSLSVKRPKSANGNWQLSIFILSREKCQHQQVLIIRSIMAQDLDGVFWLIHTIFRVLLFQYNLNSRSSFCNSGQTSTSRLFGEKNLGESFCLFINKVATGFNLLPSSWQMEQTSSPSRN